MSTTPDPVKAGIRTTEFWLALLHQLLALFLTLGLISAGTAERLEAVGFYAVTVIVALLCNSSVLGKYTHSREFLKGKRMDQDVLRVRCPVLSAGSR
jgi:hypothetical protein